MGVEERRSSALKSRRAGAGRSACLHADAGRAISTGGCGLQCGGEGNGVGGASERERERDSSGGFYCFKIQLQPEGCSAESCGPTTPPFPLPPPPPPPSFLPSAPREGAGGVPGPQAGAARRRRGRGGRGGSSRELKGLLGGVGGEKRVGVCARLAAAARLGGGSRVLILLKI